MDVTFDAEDAIRVFRAYPVAAARRTMSLIEGAAIDLQREIRENSPVFDGQYRRSVQYKLNPSRLEGTVGPTVDYAEPLEKGSRPHWTSVKEGTPLRKWADAKGISPYAVQQAIAKKGTKANPVVQQSFDSMQFKIARDITNGFGRFIQEVDSGSI